jgi:arabinose-5-phosphate isomerase
MHSGTDLPLVDAATPMSDALIIISQKGFGVAGVIDADGDLAGIITDGDLRRRMDGLLGLRAGDVMTPKPRTISPDALAEAAVAAMNERKITCLFVTDGGNGGAPLGILHIHDCLRAGIA